MIIHLRGSLNLLKKKGSGPRGIPEPTGCLPAGKSMPVQYLDQAAFDTRSMDIAHSRPRLCGSHCRAPEWHRRQGHQSVYGLVNILNPAPNCIWQCALPQPLSGARNAVDIAAPPALFLALAGFEEHEIR